MSAWSFAEFDDINWAELGMNDDHTVPQQAGELAYVALDLSSPHKKQRREVKNVGKHMLRGGPAINTVLWEKEDAYYSPTKNPSPSSVLEGSWSEASNAVVPALCSTDFSARDTSLPSQDLRVSDYDVDESDILMHRSMFCSKDPIQKLAISANENRSGLSSLNSMSSNVTDLPFLQNKRKDRDSDHVYSDWSDMSNFEDVDKMFWDWDSTFGQGQAGTEDEMSWFSSASNANYGSEIPLRTGLQSSNSKLVASLTKIEPRCSDHNFLPQNAPGSADHDKQFSSIYAGLSGRDAGNTASSANEEKLCDRDEMENIRLSQMSREYYSDESGASTVTQIERQRLPKEKETKLSTDQMTLDLDVSDVSVLQMYYSQQYSQQKHFTVSSSSYMQDLGRRSEVEFGLPNNQYPERLPDQFCTAQIMAEKENTGELYQKQNLSRTMTTEHLYQHSSFRNKASDQKEQNETGDDSEMEDVGTTLPTFEMDHPKVHMSSSMNSLVSVEASEKATSFQQLQDVMHQLDARTKLCIRDSLYRLARSANQRHDLATQNCSGGTTNAKENQYTEASKNKYCETNTNPIDRSIAHLLFHKFSETASRSTDYTISLPPRIIVMLSDQFGDG